MALVEAARQAALEQPGTPQFVVHRLASRDGSWFTVEACFTNHLDDPDIGALAYNARDITEQREAERRQLESEAHYRLLFKLSPDAVFVHRNNVLLYANDAAAHLFRAATPQALSGRDWHELVAPEDWSRTESRLASLMNGEAAFLPPTEMGYITLDGNALQVEATGARIVIDGAPAIISVVRDITERRQIEAQRLEHLRQQRDTLVREVHHRIKNHLQGLAGLLRRHMAQQPALQPVLEAFAAQINAISVVHGLQGRTENGKASLRGLVAEIATFLGGVTGVPLKLEQPEHECRWAVAEVESVPVALIVNELLTNALRHGAGGTDPAGATPVALGIRCNANGARLTIRNPGRLAPEVDFAGGQGLGTGLGLIRALLPPSGITVGLSNSPDGSVEAQIDLSAPILAPMMPDQVVSRR